MCGYCLQIDKARWQISANRTSEKAALLEASGIRPVLLSGKKVTVTDLDKADHILISVPPEQDGSDPVINFAEAAGGSSRPIKMGGYLSTTGVYGDHQGAWIDEETPAGF